MRGFLMRARAMAMRCFCPPDSCTPPSPSCGKHTGHQHKMVRLNLNEREHAAHMASKMAIFS